jgi:hypothetical protein
MRAVKAFTRLLLFNQGTAYQKARKIKAARFKLWARIIAIVVFIIFLQ